jgi:hypothetical protein
MPQFAPDQCEFGDVPGYGIWDIGHWREHIQLVLLFAAQTPQVLIPNPDFGGILSGGGIIRESLDQHQIVHDLLRQQTGVAGVDYTDIKLDQQTDFYSFMGMHADEHRQLRQVLGIM